MPFGSYNIPKTQPKPTFLQYLKTTKLSKGVEGKTIFPVEIIWLPGKFDNVTLQTHAFRYIATSEHPLYQDTIDYATSILSAIQESEDSEVITSQLGIIIASLEDKTIEVVESDKKKLPVKLAGLNGLRYIHT